MKKAILTSGLLLASLCLSAQTTYKVLNVVKNNQVVATYRLSEVDKLLIRDTIIGSEDTDTHEYVDLGLTSGTLWATCNVGAKLPADYGDYFAWGETSPKEVYADSTYAVANACGYTKYNTSSDYGVVDSLTTLEPEDDAAYVNWGDGWRMPTREQLAELLYHCTWEWTETEVDSQGDTVGGYKMTSKENGKSIFLPAAGFRDGSSVYYAGSDGSCWSSSLNGKYPNIASKLYVDSGYQGLGDDLRFLGLPVRAVRASDPGANETHASVDLGLPSGTLWATCNVGGTVAGDYGDYFAWGETMPKEKYNKDNYKLFKWTLEPEEDAAYVNWGADWRMPNSEQINELMEECTWTWTSMTDSEGNQIEGYKLTGENGKSIFLPAAGLRIGSSVYGAGIYGNCWSSSLYGVNPYYAFKLNFDFGYQLLDHSSLYTGYPVRAVRAK